MADYEVVQPNFTVGMSQASGSALVTFSGEFDIFAAPDMREVFLHPDVTSASRVQVDLTQATFLDSSALGILVSACRHVRSDGGVFGVTCPDGMVRRVLEISGLIAYLQIEEGAQALPIT